MPKKRLILASNSPRRIVLLKSLGYHFDIVPHDIEECILGDVLPMELVQNLAFLKATDVARRVSNAIIISADTVIVHKKSILGKPKDVSDAKRILSMLSDSEHDVISGVCVMEMPSRKKMLRIERTHIKMKNIKDEEIDRYILTGEPMDKAGAYAIQGEGGKFIEKIDGSYSNAVGLPLELLQEMLSHFMSDENA
ncbi:MAG: septum formation protein Maf [Planctomycetes bacterium RIFOXYB12_FULL_42_10]|nr:MAG: septum formation protein Maf [Planctomycetes bacterium GWE2_41_14]OHC05853.1 MAG: septum formation protein Maf [Planctomycetes bacterium RIFOXYB12_FULL_42_10]OHC06943.1 MAG: septum formation protein Maf [Planctomycetes bacterium RIFOXYC2_FULL_41_27]OHC11026.1 MAG: septum formation protein Maf [Planctomycetes bacterium RIFOXYD12_FULL_42_12]